MSDSIITSLLLFFVWVMSGLVYEEYDNKFSPLKIYSAPRAGDIVTVSDNWDTFTFDVPSVDIKHVVFRDYRTGVILLRINMEGDAPVCETP